MLSYLPFITKLSYTFDDWYLMWAAKAYGTQAFYSIFSVDRPLRAYIMIPAYTFFGGNPLFYNISGYVLRILGAMTFYWMLTMIWPRAKAAVLAMATLFVIYPGFLSQTNAIDYQSHLAALTIAIFSLALTIRSFQPGTSTNSTILLLVVSAVTGWIYLGLMEYYIGFELIRILIFILLASRESVSWPLRIRKAFVKWLPMALVPVLFLYWHTFIFITERKATSANVQLSMLGISPIRAVFNWAIELVKNVYVTLLEAWYKPILQLVIQISAEQIAAGVGVALLSVLITWLVLRSMDNETLNWRLEGILFGMGCLVTGMIPVVLANRQVEFPYYSRYTLISSTGAVILLVSLIYYIPVRVWRQLALSLLVFISVLTHYYNSAQAALQTASMNNFWWQVAWRIPMIEKNSTIVANYPVVSIMEDYFIWGPANLLYYPLNVNGLVMQPGIYAALPGDDTTQKVLNQEKQVYDKRRNIFTYTNYRNVLLISQQKPDSCVHVINGKNPELSTNENKDFIKMAPYSEMERIQINQQFHVPSSEVFGNEPVHEWCYFYQKTDLARQAGDWVEAARLGDEALANGFYAADQVEWLPFLQAFAVQKNTKSLEIIDQRMTDPNIRKLACSSINSIPEIDSNTNHLINTMFCQ